MHSETALATYVLFYLTHRTHQTLWGSWKGIFPIQTLSGNMKFHKILSPKFILFPIQPTRSK